ncbi:Protein CBG00999 [Caenorhabditis briggsae]|uniref:Protein CBG00999 n=1 Tax=Caenorhabditis briggsae TaxID=6238 RepID=A8WP50_CAEBR|nr:Protein CBG00999 [Caenorhabditis briggsae]CAP22256.1 Protein CBG00999 [Caenorhabditis briggsae]
MTTSTTTTSTTTTKIFSNISSTTVKLDCFWLQRSFSYPAGTYDGNCCNSNSVNFMDNRDQSWAAEHSEDARVEYVKELREQGFCEAVQFLDGKDPDWRLGDRVINVRWATRNYKCGSFIEFDMRTSTTTSATTTKMSPNISSTTVALDCYWLKRSFSYPAGTYDGSCCNSISVNLMDNRYPSWATEHSEEARVKYVKELQEQRFCECRGDDTDETYFSVQCPLVLKSDCNWLGTVVDYSYENQNYIYHCECCNSGSIEYLNNSHSDWKSAVINKNKIGEYIQELNRTGHCGGVSTTPSTTTTIRTTTETTSISTTSSSLNCGVFKNTECCTESVTKCLEGKQTDWLSLETGYESQLKECDCELSTTSTTTSTVSTETTTTISKFNCSWLSVPFQDDSNGWSTPFSYNGSCCSKTAVNTLKENPGKWILDSTDVWIKRNYLMNLLYCTEDACTYPPRWENCSLTMTSSSSTTSPTTTTPVLSSSPATTTDSTTSSSDSTSTDASSTSPTDISTTLKNTGDNRKKTTLETTTATDSTTDSDSTTPSETTMSSDSTSSVYESSTTNDPEVSTSPTTSSSTTRTTANDTDVTTTATIGSLSSTTVVTTAETTVTTTSLPDTASSGNSTTFGGATASTMARSSETTTTITITTKSTNGSTETTLTTPTTTVTTSSNSTTTTSGAQTNETLTPSSSTSSPSPLPSRTPTTSGTEQNTSGTTVSSSSRIVSTTISTKPGTTTNVDGVYFRNTTVQLFENCTQLTQEQVYFVNGTRLRNDTVEFNACSSTSPLTTPIPTTTFNWPTGTTRILPSGEIVLSEVLQAFPNCTTVLMQLIFNSSTNETRTEVSSNPEGCKTTFSSSYVTSPMTTPTPSTTAKTTTYNWPTGGTTRILPSGEIIISESLIAYKNCTTVLMQLIYTPSTNETRTETTVDEQGCKASSTTLSTSKYSTTPMLTTKPTQSTTARTTTFNWPTGGTTRVLPSGEIILSESLIAYKNCTTVLMQLIYNPTTNETRTETTTDAQGCKASSSSTSSKVTTTPMSTTVKSTTPATTTFAWPTAEQPAHCRLILSESLIAYKNCTTVLMQLIYNPKTNTTRTESTSDAEGCKATTTTTAPSVKTTTYNWPTGGTTRVLPSGEIIISESLIAYKNCTTVLMQLIYNPSTNTTRTETTADAQGCKASSTTPYSVNNTSPMTTSKPTSCAYPDLDLTNTIRPTEKELKTSYSIGEQLVHICKKYYAFEIAGQPFKLYQCMPNGKWAGVPEKCIAEERTEL